MSTTKFILTTNGFFPSLHIKPIYRSATGVSLYSSSTDIASVKKRLLWCNNKTVGKEDKSGRFLARSARRPRPPPPPEAPFNFIKWIMAFAITVVVPFFSNKWASIHKLKTALRIAENRVVIFEVMAEAIKKAAEEVAVGLPEGGWLRKAVEFVGNMANGVNNGAHFVDDIIHEVEDVEEKGERVEHVAEEATIHGHEHLKQE